MRWLEPYWYRLSPLHLALWPLSLLFERSPPSAAWSIARVCSPARKSAYGHRGQYHAAVPARRRA